MRQLHNTRRAVFLRDARPLLPETEGLGFERAFVAADVAGDGEEAAVNLDLAGDEEAVAGARPEAVEVLEGVDGGVEVGAFGLRFLHRAFYQAVGEGEAAGEGDGLGEDGDC